MTQFRATLLRHTALPGTLAAVLAVGLLLAPAQARAQSSDTTAMIKLIQLLIDKGVLTPDQASALVKQAQAEAHAAKPAKAKPAATTAGEPVPPPAAEPPPVPPGTQRVPYVPQIVRDQSAGEVRAQVMQQAQNEGWAAPNQAPEWIKRIRFYGDVRVRAEELWQNKSNAPLPDFNAINSSTTGYDDSTGALPPSLNTNENRTRGRLRARLGMQAQIDDWVTSDIRIATGNDNSPVSTNQTLGSGGDFSKYALWLDRAYLTLTPYQSLKMYVGRTPNPFWTTDLMYNDDLSFDGISAMTTYPLNGMLDVFVNAGAFSLYNTELGFSTFNTPKFPSHNKYLFAAQAGVNYKPRPDVLNTFALGFFDYASIDGKGSQPCTIIQANIGCNTDASRAQALQTGNTLFAIRNINFTGSSSANPQYYGLASRFDILDLRERLQYTGFKVPMALDMEFSKNLGYSRSYVVNRNPVNNIGNNNAYQGGDTGYMFKLVVGKTDVVEKWDWNLYAGYKYIESDAVLDGLTDSTFHGGGTNAKGYMLGGSLGIAHNLWLVGRYFATTQVSGPSEANQLLQIDLNARF
jgi:hypothetical protein